MENNQKNNRSLSFIEKSLIHGFKLILKFISRNKYTTLTLAAFISVIAIYYLPHELRWIITQWWKPIWSDVKLNDDTESAIITLFGSIFVGFATVGVTVYVTWKINKQTQTITERIQFEMIDQQKKQSAYDNFYNRQYELINELRQKLNTFYDAHAFNLKNESPVEELIEDLQSFHKDNETYFNQTLFHDALFLLVKNLKYRTSAIRKYNFLIRECSFNPLSDNDQKAFKKDLTDFVDHIVIMIAFILKLMDVDISYRINDSGYTMKNKEAKQMLEQRRQHVEEKIAFVEEETDKIIHRIEGIITKLAETHNKHMDEFEF